MKTTLMMIAVLGVSMLGSFQLVHADPFLDEITANQWFNTGDSHSWTFDLDNDPLSPGDIGPEDIILPPSTLSIYFLDNETDTLRPATWELARTEFDGIPGTLLPFAVDTGTQTYDLGVWLSIVGDHQLNVTVTSTFGDFSVVGLSLAGDYFDRTAPVPEPSTMLLLGTGLIGFMGFRKRSRR